MAAIFAKTISQKTAIRNVDRLNVPVVRCFTRHRQAIAGVIPERQPRDGIIVVQDHQTNVLIQRSPVNNRVLPIRSVNVNALIGCTGSHRAPRAAVISGLEQNNITRLRGIQRGLKIVEWTSIGSITVGIDVRDEMDDCEYVGWQNQQDREAAGGKTQPVQ